VIIHSIPASLYLVSPVIVLSYANRGAVIYCRHSSVQQDPLTPITRVWPLTSMVMNQWTTGLLVLVCADMSDTSDLSIVIFQFLVYLVILTVSSNLKTILYCH